MDTSNPITRAIAAGLPLVIIAIIFGAAGYAFTSPGRAAIPPLPEPAERPAGVRGIVQLVSGDQITLTTEQGTSYTLTLTPGAPVEALGPAAAVNPEHARAVDIGIADIRVGDWLNAGAIPHAQTILAIEGIVLIENPVVQQ